MILYPQAGAYSPRQMVMTGGFQLNTSSAPTVFRDGTKVSSAQKMFSVARTSAGLYTVTFIAGFPLPALPFVQLTLEQAAGPTTPGKIHYVKGSWSLTTRSFQIQLQSVGTTPAASDLDATDRVHFTIRGAIDSIGVDPA